jgi:hypothetical protein
MYEASKQQQKVERRRRRRLHICSEERAAQLLYTWAKCDVTSFKEFESLLAAYLRKDQRDADIHRERSLRDVDGLGEWRRRQTAVSVG